MGTRLTGFALVVIVCGGLVGCADTPPPQAAPQAIAPAPLPPPTALAAPPIAGPQWTLETMGGVAVKTERQPTLFVDNGQVNGNSGCNTYAGSATLGGSNLSFGTIASTKMACVGDAMTIEATFFDMLARVRVATTVGGALVVYDATGTALARFTTKPAK